MKGEWYLFFCLVHIIKIGLVSGFFDPFTIGHLEMVKQASQLFDVVHVVIFTNSKKTRKYDTEKMVNAIKKTLTNLNITNAIVTSSDGLLAKYCETNHIEYNVHGLRNNMDYNYEENIREVNQLLNPNLKTIYLYSGINISSSTVKELLAYGENVEKFVPKEIIEVII